MVKNSRAVMTMYKHARTRIRSYGGSVSEWFGVNVEYTKAQC